MARRSRFSQRLLLATAILALVPFGLGAWYLAGAGPGTGASTLLVKKGATLESVAQELESRGIIRSAAMFKLWARARRLQLIRGEYTLAPRASLLSVEERLRRGDVTYTKVVLTPSLHAWAVQRRLKDFVPEDIFWTLWKSPRLARVAGFPEAESLEGLVAPATYRLHRAMEPEEVMLQLVEAFRDQVRPSLDGGTLEPYDTLRLASLVEKETGVASERPEVAGVYLRRLRKGMRLQCDPTSQYARWMSGDLRFTAPTGEDVRRPHRFNTYTVAGLPPTPIAIPGPESIEAAKAPAEGNALFFVATGKGGHRFAENLSEHNRNVSAYRRELQRKKS